MRFPGIVISPVYFDAHRESAPNGPINRAARTALKLFFLDASSIRSVLIHLESGQQYA
jgi:hypothetical protein